MAEIKVVWDVQARDSFRKYIDHIKKDSLQAAEKVRKEILEIVRNLPDHPEKYPPDKYKRLNDGSFRAFEKYSCRIAYVITAAEIRVLRARHVKQEPKEY